MRTLSIIGILSALAISAAHAEPSREVKAWLPQLDDNLADINAMNKTRGETARWSREGYTIVLTKQLSGEFSAGMRGLMKTDPARATKIMRKALLDQACTNKFRDLLDVDLSIEMRFTDPQVPIRTALHKGDCDTYPRG